MPTSDNDGFVHTDVIRWTHVFQEDTRFDVVYRTRLGRPLENNLNRTARLVALNDFDFWLTIDKDNPPINNPLSLCFLDRDIIGFPTPIFRYEITEDERCPPPIELNVFDRIQGSEVYRTRRDHWGLQECDAVGGGCLLIAQRVMRHPALQYQPFSRMVDELGFYRLGNDLSFCQRAKDAGFRVWAHYGYQCEHFRQVSLACIRKGYEDAYSRELRRREAKKQEAG